MNHQSPVDGRESPSGKGPHWRCLIVETGSTLWSSKVVNDEAAILEAIGEVLERAVAVSWAVDITSTCSALLLALLTAHGRRPPPCRDGRSTRCPPRTPARPKLTPGTQTLSPRQRAIAVT
ncbi:MAG: IS110 family transposase [Humibacillus sp.]|nr:IS110 family transposase [Humibacillus sp.]MDN5777343.1 IS110 family transposase [Humibacillus sp.]